MKEAIKLLGRNGHRYADGPRVAEGDRNEMIIINVREAIDIM